MIRIAGKVAGGLRIAGKVAGGLRIAGNTITFGSVYEFARTLDRTFTDTPASGGGNVDPQQFVHAGANWELWQVVPYLGAGVGPPTVGDCRVQLRNRDKSRGQNELADMPDQVIVKRDGWANSPWTFTRPTAGNKFSNVASGNSARKAIDYEPDRSVGANPTAEGIAQGQDFTVTLIWAS